MIPAERTGADSKAYVLSGPGLSLRTLDSSGAFEKAVSIPLYSGAAYYSSMFIDSAGQAQ